MSAFVSIRYRVSCLPVLPLASVSGWLAGNGTLLKNSMPSILLFLWDYGLQKTLENLLFRHAILES